jgi:hypothetical protein
MALTNEPLALSLAAQLPGCRAAQFALHHVVHLLGDGRWVIQGPERGAVVHVRGADVVIAKHLETW